MMYNQEFDDNIRYKEFISGFNKRGGDIQVAFSQSQNLIDAYFG